MLDDTHSCQELLIVNAVYQPFLLLPTPGISVMAPALKKVVTGGKMFSLLSSDSTGTEETLKPVKV